MLTADMQLAFDPAWSGSTIAVAAAALAVLTIWTYLGVKNATWRRIAIVLLLRLMALLVAFGMMLRPSLAFTELEGVELTRLLVVFDASESMSIVEKDDEPSRWDSAEKLWASRPVQRRLDQLRAEQKIEAVKYLAAADLRPDEPDARPDGKRTDIGAWLHLLHQKHAHEKHLRGIVLVSDGGDNGTRFSAQEKARLWRGIAPIHAFGVGDPANPKYRKDIALTRLDAGSPVAAKAKLTVTAIAQAPGFKGAEVEVAVFSEHVVSKETKKIGALPRSVLKEEKDQPIVVMCDAPEDPGEYKLTLRIAPHADEANKDNNEISTYVQVIKPQIHVLWVDRPRVYEPTFAIRALAQEPRFKVTRVQPPDDAKGDPFAFYQFDKRHYDVIVIGDLSAEHFSLGNPKIFDKIRDLVLHKQTGLLMLGGTETFAAGGWHKHPAIAELLPVAFDEKAAFSKAELRAERVKGAPELPFLKLEVNEKKNDELWTREFDVLEGFAPIGTLTKDATALLKAGDTLLMAAKRNADAGHVVVFGADNTSRAWYGNQSAVTGYKKFWKQLVYWLSKEEDQANQLVLKLDKRRINANADESLGFTFFLRGKDGLERPGATFKVKVIGPTQEYPINHARDKQQQRGTFSGARDPGEHHLRIEGRDGDVAASAEARFLVAFDDLERARPLADHDALARIAAAGEGRFQVLDETALVQYLDELKGQVNRESRHKTTHWPDWNRLPASEQTRDQLSGLWNSFALLAFVAFVALLCTEWLLRRLWGLV